MSKTAADGEAGGHPRKGRKAWRGPRVRVSEGREGTCPCVLIALVKEAEEGMTGGADGAEGADSEVHDSEVGRKGHGVITLEAVLVTARVTDDVDVGGYM